MTTDDVMMFLYKRGGEATFAEFSRYFPGCRGTLDLLVPRVKNAVVWWGLNLQFIKCLDRLRAEGKIKYTRTDPSVYKIFNLRPKYPVANGKGFYPKPVWVPVLVEVSIEGPKSTEVYS